MTNLSLGARLALVLLASCSAGEPSIKTNPDPVASSMPAVGQWIPPKVAVAPSASSAAAAGLMPVPNVSATPPSDEALIREYQSLAGKHATKSELEKFVSEHKRLLEATAHPYGPTVMWVLEYEHEEASLVLFHAGATLPPGTLALAARGGLNAFIDAMLAKGANPNGVDNWGYTPLHAAAKYGHVETVRKLLAAKAVSSPRASNDGFTPLHVAVMERKEEVLSVLIAAGADLEARDDQGRTPLHWGPFAYKPKAIHIYHHMGEPHETEFVDPGPAKGIVLLLNAGAKIDAVDDDGDTPLHDAARLGSVRGAEALLARGAKVNAKNKAGETPLSIAKDGDHRQAVLKVLQRGR